jgi:hypothetical protein
MSRRTTTIACLIAVILHAGCYSFRPIEPGDVAPGRTVRVTISPEQTLRLQPALGELRTTLQGQVVAAESPAMIGLTVAANSAAPGSRSAFNAFVTVPLSAVERIEERRFSYGRTLALAGAAAIVGVAVLAVDAGGTNDGEDPPSNSRVRVPLLRWAIR